MHQFWYDYNKPKCQQNAKLCYMDTDSFIIPLKLKILMKMLQTILKQDLTHHIMHLKDHYQEVKIKK